MTTIPNGSPYETILDGYLGTDYADQKSGFVTQKDVLWINFLAENGLKATDPLVVAQDPSILLKFVAFVQKTYDSMQVGTNLSPDETSRRKLMFSVYDLIVLMLETLQKNVGVVGNNVVFLSKYQKEYSTMMGRLSQNFQIGGSRSLPEPNPADLSQWTLGYGKITMAEYIKTAVDNSAAGSAITSEINSVNTVFPLPPANVQQTTTSVLQDALKTVPITLAGKEINKVSLFDSRFPYANDTINKLSFTSHPATPTTPAYVSFDYTYKQQYNATIIRYSYNKADPPVLVQSSDPEQVQGFYPQTFSSGVTFPAGATEDEKIKLTTAAFQTFLNTNMSFSAVPPGFTPSGSYATYTISSNIPQPSLTVYNSMTQPVTIYPFRANDLIATGAITITRNITTAWDPLYNMPYTSTTDSTQTQHESAASRRRGAVNSQLQQYITDSQTQKQILSNRADAQTSQENQSQTGFNQGASLLHTMIGQLSTILTSIFQVSG